MTTTLRQPRWPRHSAELRANNGLNYWTPGTGPGWRMACTAIGYAAGPHTWHPDFTDLYPTAGLPWPVKTHA